MKTIEQVQLAIAKGHHVYFKNHNENHPVTFFKISNGLITIEAGNVRRFKISALDYFLRKATIA